MTVGRLSRDRVHPRGRGGRVDDPRRVGRLPHDLGRHAAARRVGRSVGQAAGAARAARSPRATGRRRPTLAIAGSDVARRPQARPAPQGAAVVRDVRASAFRGDVPRAQPVGRARGGADLAAAGRRARDYDGFVVQGRRHGGARRRSAATARGDVPRSPAARRRPWRWRTGRRGSTGGRTCRPAQGAGRDPRLHARR